jgi:hypothetical protein
MGGFGAVDIRERQQTGQEDKFCIHRERTNAPNLTIWRLSDLSNGRDDHDQKHEHEHEGIAR